MPDEDFPVAVLIPSVGSITRRDEVFDIYIDIQPFELDSETISTQFRFDGAKLPLAGPSAWAGQTFTFPANPTPGYIDGSIYIRSSHNPADLTTIIFGELHGGTLDATLSIAILFEYEGAGFRDINITLHVPFEVTAA